MTSHSPLLYEYLKKYQENPRSRVFAPLAEAYRKAGLLSEAVEIAREGLQIHPSFIGGKVALARALFDQREFEKTADVLATVVGEAPENLVAQKIYAECCLLLGRITDALHSYKMLLFYSPEDPELGRLVQELESQAYEGGAIVLRQDPHVESDSTPDPGFEVAPARSAIEESPSVKKASWIEKVELLQDLLSRVERYRAQA